MTTATKTNPWNKKKLIYELVVLFFMFGFQFLPLFGEMTPMGMQIAGIFIGAIIGWVTLGFVFPNIVGIIALSLSDAFPNPLTCYQNAFASDTAVMILGCLFVCAFIEMTDLPDVIVGFLLNLKIAKSNVVVFLILFFIAEWLVSGLSQSVLTTYIFIVLYRQIAKEAGIEPFSKLNSFILCGIALVATFGDIAFPFKPVSISILTVIEEFTGEPFSFIGFLLYCSLFQLIIIALLVLAGRFILRIDYSKFVERFPELSLFYRLFSPLNSEMICIFPYFCPYAESAREIREIFS